MRSSLRTTWSSRPSRARRTAACALARARPVRRKPCTSRTASRTATGACCTASPCTRCTTRPRSNSSTRTTRTTGTRPRGRRARARPAPSARRTGSSSCATSSSQRPRSSCSSPARASSPPCRPAGSPRASACAGPRASAPDDIWPSSWPSVVLCSFAVESNPLCLFHIPVPFPLATHPGQGSLLFLHSRVSRVAFSYKLVLRDEGGIPLRASFFLPRSSASAVIGASRSSIHAPASARAGLECAPSPPEPVFKLPR